MNERIPPIYPSPKPDWMKSCNLAYFTSAKPTPVDLVVCPVGGVTSEVRYQWWPKVAGDYQYSPTGLKLGVWMSSDPTLSFEGKYEHKKVIRSHGSVPFKAEVWIRFWDENGFMWDSPSIVVASSTNDGGA